jgi:hypothetical protein
MRGTLLRGYLIQKKFTNSGDVGRCSPSGQAAVPQERVGQVRGAPDALDPRSAADVLTAIIRGAGKAPASSCQRALSHQGKPSLAGQPRFSSLVAAPGHVGLSAIAG